MEEEQSFEGIIAALKRAQDDSAFIMNSVEYDPSGKFTKEVLLDAIKQLEKSRPEKDIVPLQVVTDQECETLSMEALSFIGYNCRMLVSTTGSAILKRRFKEEK